MKRVFRWLLLVLIVLLVACGVWLYEANKKLVVAARTFSVAQQMANLTGKSQPPLSGHFKFRGDAVGADAWCWGEFIYQSPVVYDVSFESSIGPYRIVRNEDLWIHFIGSNEVLVGVAGRKAEARAFPDRAGVAKVAPISEMVLVPPLLAAIPGSIEPFLKEKFDPLKKVDITLLAQEKMDEREVQVLSVEALEPMGDVTLSRIKLWVDLDQRLLRRVSLSGSYRTVPFQLQLSSEDIDRIPQNEISFIPPEDARITEMALDDLLMLLSSSKKIHPRKRVDRPLRIEP